MRSQLQCKIVGRGESGFGKGREGMQKGGVSGLKDVGYCRLTSRIGYVGVEVKTVS